MARPDAGFGTTPAAVAAQIPGWVATLCRARYPILILLSIYLLPDDVSARGTSDWIYFTEAARDFGLHLYAEHPEIQIGPLAVLVGAALGTSQVIPRLLISAMGILVLLLLEKAALATKREPSIIKLTTLLGGAALLTSWEAVVRVTHLDDALALTFVAVALFAVSRNQTALAGAAIGMALLTKPWALVASPVLFGLTSAWPALSIAGCIALLGWLPFLVSDAGSLEAARFRIPVAEDSGLRVLGLDGHKVPAWVRPVQLAAGAGLSALVALRGYWPAVLFVGFATRQALDAGTHGYYDAALLTGALTWDSFMGRTGLPIWTVVMFVFHQGVWVYFTERHVSGFFLLILVPVLLGLIFSGRTTQPEGTAA